MSRIDWRGLMQAGLGALQLRPAEFWALTPLELRVMLGADHAVPPLTRARLEDLAAAFPDRRSGDGRDRHIGRAGRGAGGADGRGLGRDGGL